MSLESLLNKPMIEQELSLLLTQELQSNYKKYQNTFCFMKLSHVGEKKVQITWIKTFSSHPELMDFYWDSELVRACAMFKFHKARYDILWSGFFLIDGFSVWPNHVTDSRPMIASGCCETRKMIPREVSEQGFGEIFNALQSSKKPKAV